MKLYRGVKTFPKLYTPEVKAHHQVIDYELEKMEAEGAGMIDLLRHAARKNLTAFMQLANSQFYTDQYEIAKDFAGENGYIMSIDVPLGLAMDHYKGEQRVKSTAMPCSNFVFSGEELEKNTDQWKLEVEDLNSTIKSTRYHIAAIYYKDKLANNIRHLKAKDIITSVSGTRRKVLSINGDKILFEQSKKGKTTQVAYSRKVIFEDQGLDWIEDIQVFQK